MLALGEPLYNHSRIELEHRIVLENFPVFMLPDRPPKFLLVALLEKHGFDAGCIVGGRNCRIVGVLDGEGNSHGVGRFGLDLHERPLQFLVEFGIPRNVFFLHLVAHWFLGIVTFRLADIVLLNSLGLGLWFFSVGLAPLTVIARAVLSALLMAMSVLFTVMM